MCVRYDTGYFLLINRKENALLMNRKRYSVSLVINIKMK